MLALDVIVYRNYTWYEAYLERTCAEFLICDIFNMIHSGKAQFWLADSPMLINAYPLFLISCMLYVILNPFPSLISHMA